MEIFKHFSDSVVQGITTKEGGYSKAPYGMNISFFTEDDTHAVCQNIKATLDELKTSAKRIVVTRQTHSDHILLIDETFDFDTLGQIDVSGTALEGYLVYTAEDFDAVITNQSNLILMTSHADCVPILLSDTGFKVVAAIHSGWRGTSKQIVKKAIEMIEARFAIKAEEILAGIGQSAGICCYEVDIPVIESLRFNYSNSLLEDYIVPKDYGKYHIDLKGINRQLMIQMGVPSDHIEVIDACTICHPKAYHSHRYSGNHRGVMGAFIGLI